MCAPDSEMSKGLGRRDVVALEANNLRLWSFMLVAAFRRTHLHHCNLTLEFRGKQGWPKASPVIRGNDVLAAVRPRPSLHCMARTGALSTRRTTRCVPCCVALRERATASGIPSPGGRPTSSGLRTPIIANCPISQLDRSELVGCSRNPRTRFRPLRLRKTLTVFEGLRNVLKLQQLAGQFGEVHLCLQRSCPEELASLIH